MTKILIMGLPGSGKTWLAERLQEKLECAWFNADEVRGQANDWNFSEAARLRQARRMRNIADFEKGEGNIVICDFVCPTELTRHILKPILQCGWIQYLLVDMKILILFSNNQKIMM